MEIVGAEERDETDWGGEERLMVRSRDLSLEIEDHRKHFIFSSLIVDKSEADLFFCLFSIRIKARPNLIAFRITSTLPALALPTLFSLLSSTPPLRQIFFFQLTSSSLPSNLQILNHFLSQFSINSIHHLSLTSSSFSSLLLGSALVSLLLLNRSGFKYLDLRVTSTFTMEDSLSQSVLFQFQSPLEFRDVCKM